MRRSGIVIGLGETGKLIYNLLRRINPDTLGYDIRYKDGDEVPVDVVCMHVCFPFTDGFVEAVSRYQSMYKPEMTIIHTNVPDGVVERIKGAVRASDLE